MVVSTTPLTEPVKMSREIVEMIFARLESLQTSLNDVREKQIEHTHHLDEQDRQRGVMWSRVDEVAASQRKTQPIIEDTAERVSEIDTTVKENLAGMQWATRIRKFLLWVGGLTITGLLMAGTAALVGWLVSHWSELFRRG